MYWRQLVAVVGLVAVFGLHVYITERRLAGLKIDPEDMRRWIRQNVLKRREPSIGPATRSVMTCLAHKVEGLRDDDEVFLVVGSRVNSVSVRRVRAALAETGVDV